MASAYGCKLCRVLGERDREHYNDRILSQWKGEHSSRKGYLLMCTRWGGWTTILALNASIEAARAGEAGDEPEEMESRIETLATAVERSRDHVDDVDEQVSSLTE